MVIEQYAGFNLGKVFCSLEVKEVLNEASIPQDEILRFHQLSPTPELRAEHIRSLSEKDWICSSFEMRQSGKTVCIVTDPQQTSTNLYLEP